MPPARCAEQLNAVATHGLQRMGMSELKSDTAPLLASKLLRWLSAALMVVLSLLAALAAFELGLRLFFPKYESVAHSQRYRADTSRIWAPIPNSSIARLHPDTGRRHPVIYNEFGSRQHRNFPVDVLEQAENIAFFGDSFTENSGLEAPYSFTESLDFLLNLHDGKAFNVLNFGLDGYGPGQLFIWYQQFPNKDELDRVVYVFCDNDIKNFHDHALFSLDDDGDLVANVAYQRAIPITLLSRFHLTYLAMDAFVRWNLFRKTVPAPTLVNAPARTGSAPLHEIERRIMQREERGSDFSGDAVDDSIAAFQALLLHWKAQVEARDQQFHIVVLPYIRRTWVDQLMPMSLDVFYLEECFSRLIPNYDYSDWRFQADAHWNEAGNMVAAHCLYRFLERQSELPRLPDVVLANARHEYYRAIATSGWTPPTAWATPPTRSAHDRAEIVAKYMALDRRQRLLELIDLGEPLVRSDWNIHWISDQGDSRVLAYTKTSCRPMDRANAFFLHVTPRDPQSLPSGRAEYGFENLDFDFAGSQGMWARGCMVSAKLPSYPIARVRTGQFQVQEMGDLEVLWEAEFAVDGPPHEESAESTQQVAPPSAPR